MQFSDGEHANRFYPANPMKIAIIFNRVRNKSRSADVSVLFDIAWLNSSWPLVIVKLINLLTVALVARQGPQFTLHFKAQLES